MAKDGTTQPSWDRKLTVQVETGGTYLEMAEAIWKQLGTSSVSCMQPHGPGRFQLTLTSLRFLERLVAEGLRYKDRRVTVYPLVQPFRWMTVRNAPYEMPMEEIVEALAPYGKVAEHQYEHWSIRGIKVLNGDRRFRVNMERPVPNILRVGNYTLICTYAGVTIQCRKCGGAGHQMARCQVIICHGCQGQGHRVAHCPANKQQVPPRPEPQPVVVVPAAEPVTEEPERETERREESESDLPVSDSEAEREDSESEREDSESEREVEAEREVEKAESEVEAEAEREVEAEAEREEEKAEVEPVREESTDQDIRLLQEMLDRMEYHVRPEEKLFSDVVASSPPLTRSAAARNLDRAALEKSWSSCTKCVIPHRRLDRPRPD